MLEQAEQAEIVPPEILEPPARDEYRHLHQADCAQVLDGYLHRLARQDALCRRVLGRLAVAFLRRRGHHKLGFAKLGDYTRERLGISGREFQKLARVARRLEELPGIAAAFEDGTISWTQARLLVGVATAETEREWLVLARDRTVRALQALLTARGQASVDDEVVEGEPRLRFWMRCPGRVRSLWRETVELARRMAGAELAPWQAAEAIGAEGLSAPESVPSPRPRATPPAAGDPDEPPLSCADWRNVREAIPEDVGRLVNDCDCVHVFRLDENLRRCLRQIQRIDWQMGRLLRLFVDLRLHRFFGLPSSARYVRERLGLSARKMRTLVALERKTWHVPALTDTYREGRISWLGALTLLPVMSEAHGEAWVARAGEVTLRRLVAEVEWALESRRGSPPPLGTTLVVPEGQMRAHEEHELADAELRFSGPASVLALFRAAVVGLKQPAEPPWRGLERLLRHAKHEWTHQPRHRDPIFERDGWRCAVPICTARMSLHDHHVVFRSRGGENSRDNRTAVCAWHHLRGIHRGVVKVSGRAPDDLVWEIGVRRGRPPLLRTHGECYLTAEAS